MTRAIAVPTGRLAELIAIVDDGLDTYIRVGSALAEIRDEHLYKLTHTTFEAFCKERWSFTSDHGRRLIDASEVAGQILPIGRISPPANEAQARELAPLLNDPPALREAWAEASRITSRPTAKLVREVVRRKKTTPAAGVQSSMPVPRDPQDERLDRRHPWTATPGCTACSAIEQTGRAHDYVAHEGARPAVIETTAEHAEAPDYPDAELPDRELTPAPPAAKPCPVTLSGGVAGLPEFGHGRRDTSGPLTKTAQVASNKRPAGPGARGHR